MDKRPVINAYLDAEKMKEIELIDEEDKKFSLWLAEFEKDDTRDVTMAFAFIKFENDMARFKNNDSDDKTLIENFARFENDMAKLFDLTPAERVKKATNYFRRVIANDKAYNIGYLESAFRNLSREYQCKPDIVDRIVTFRVYLIKKCGANSFQGTMDMVRDALEGRYPRVRY
ncbi:MAG: hypothetical protein ACOYL8_04795 [Patescibacteria group bacterium]